MNRISISVISCSATNRVKSSIVYNKSKCSCLITLKCAKHIQDGQFALEYLMDKTIKILKFHTCIVVIPSSYPAPFAKERQGYIQMDT